MVRVAVSLVLALAGGCFAASPLPTIEWDSASLRLIAEGADYGRMVRLGDGSVGCVYDRGGRMCFRRSTDDGRTFGATVVVAEDAECWLTNAYLLPLKGGRLLYFWDERPRAALPGAKAGPSTRPFVIRAARSDDLGRTWTRPSAVYAGGTKFGDGCWEPAAVQLPGGGIQLYFANESPYRASDEQEITLLRSSDGGVTWSGPRCVAFRAGHRDGMPAPLLLADGTVALAVEDNGLSPRGRFKIAVVSSAADWPGAPVTGEDGRRRGALAEPLPDATYAGAPFLARLPSGVTVLSCQESEDGSLRHCRLAVYVGDEHAQGFTNRTTPLPAPVRGNQLWNSLFVRDERTVTAVSNTTVDGVRGVYAIDGRVVYPNRTTSVPRPRS